jgi:hypothetical protein
MLPICAIYLFCVLEAVMYLCARTVDFPPFSIGVLIFFVFHFIILNIVTVSIVACATGTFTGCTNDMMI